MRSWSVGCGKVAQRTGTITMALDGVERPWRELHAPHGGGVWLIASQPGVLQIDYHASLTAALPAPGFDPSDELVYLRSGALLRVRPLVGLPTRHLRHLNEPREVPGRGVVLGPNPTGVPSGQQRPYRRRRRHPPGRPGREPGLRPPRRHLSAGHGYPCPPGGCLRPRDSTRWTFTLRPRPAPTASARWSTAHCSPPA
jgi:hypothetical protein